MIHYICDRCKRTIDTDEETRFVVHIEIQSAADEPLVEMDDDIDHLTELHQLLGGLEGSHPAGDHLDDDLMGLHHPDDMDAECESSHRGRYDLCPECHHQFLQNPLGRDAMFALGFSNN